MAQLRFGLSIEPRARSAEGDAGLALERRRLADERLTLALELLALTDEHRAVGHAAKAREVLAAGDLLETLLLESRGAAELVVLAGLEGASALVEPGGLGEAPTAVVADLDEVGIDRRRRGESRGSRTANDREGQDSEEFVRERHGQPLLR